MTKTAETYTMLLDWKNQYCQNDYTTQGNLQIKLHPYQITFFTELEQQNLYGSRKDSR